MCFRYNIYIYIYRNRNICNICIYTSTVYCRHRIWSSTLTKLHPEIKKIVWSRASGAFAENHDRLVPVGPNVFHWRTVSCTSAFRKETYVTKSYTYFINHISSLYLPYQKASHVGKQQIPFWEKSIEIPTKIYLHVYLQVSKTLRLLEVTTIAWGFNVSWNKADWRNWKNKLIKHIERGSGQLHFGKSKSKVRNDVKCSRCGKTSGIWYSDLQNPHVPYGPNVCSWSHNGFWALILRSFCG